MGLDARPSIRQGPNDQRGIAHKQGGEPRGLRAALDPLNLHDLVGFDAAGRDDLHHVANFLADHAARQGGGNRDAALLHVGFMFANDLIAGRLFGILVDEANRRAERGESTRGNWDRCSDII